MLTAALLALVLLAVQACGVPEPPASVPELAKRAAAGDAEAVKKLFALLGRDTPAEQRSEAYRALLEAGSKNVGPAALAASRDADAVRREHALALVGNFKPEGAFDAAREALADASFPRSYVAAWVLRELADPRAIPLLVEALVRGEPPQTAREAARSLSSFGAPSVAPIVARLGSMSGAPRGYAIRILGEIRSAEAKPALIQALSDPALRLDALWALGTMGPSVGAPVDLTAYLSDPDWRIRAEACRSVGFLETKAAEPVLERMRRSDPVIEVREWAARGLSLLRGEHEQYMTPGNAWDNPDQLYR